MFLADPPKLSEIDKVRAGTHGMSPTGPKHLAAAISPESPKCITVRPVEYLERIPVLSTAALQKLQ